MQLALWLIVLVSLYLVSEVEARHRRARRIAHRETLTPAQFYQRYYRYHGFGVAATDEIVSFVGAAMGLAAGRLRPGDVLAELCPRAACFDFVDSDYDFFWEMTVASMCCPEECWDEAEMLLEGCRTLHDYVLAMTEMMRRGWCGELSMAARSRRLEGFYSNFAN